MSGLNQELLRQCIHRFRTLEVALADAGENGASETAEFKQRVARLQKASRALERLNEMQSRAMRPQDYNSAVDLPVLEDCSRSEQKIIQAALGASSDLIASLNQDSERLLKYVRLAQTGHGSWFFNVFRLSWMRARILWTERQLESVRSMRQILESFIKKIVPGRVEQGKQGDLVESFREFEATTARIGNLRTRLRSEMALNHEQQVWLRKYDERRRREASPFAPPLPAEVGLVAQTVERRILGGAHQANESLVIATRLAKTLTPTSEFETVAPKETAAKSKRKSAKTTGERA